MYFSEEPDHTRMLRDTMRKFVDEEMPREKVREWTRDHYFPADVFKRLAELCVCGITIDEEKGGFGRDLAGQQRQALIHMHTKRLLFDQR